MRICKGPGQSSQKIHDSDTGLKERGFRQVDKVSYSFCIIKKKKKEKNWVGVGHYQIKKKEDFPAIGI